MVKGRIVELHWLYCINTQEDWWRLKVVFPKYDTWRSGTFSQQLHRHLEPSLKAVCLKNRSLLCSVPSVLWQDEVMAPRLAVVGGQRCWHCLNLRLSQQGTKLLGQVLGKFLLLPPHVAFSSSLSVKPKCGHRALGIKSCSSYLWRTLTGVKISDNRRRFQFCDKSQTRSNGWNETYRGLK